MKRIRLAAVFLAAATLGTTVQRIVHVAAKLEGPPDVSRARAAGPAAPAPDDDDSRDSYGDGGTGA